MKKYNEALMKFGDFKLGDFETESNFVLHTSAGSPAMKVVKFPVFKRDVQVHIVDEKPKVQMPAVSTTSSSPSHHHGWVEKTNHVALERIVFEDLSAKKNILRGTKYSSNAMVEKECLFERHECVKNTRQTLPGAILHMERVMAGA